MNNKVNNNEINSWEITRYRAELSLIKSFLTDPDYEMFGFDFDFDTPLTDLARKAQKEIIALKNQVEALKKEVTSLTVEKYKTPDYKYIYEELLNPPAYQPNNQEIMLAKARYVFDNEIWQTVYYLRLYINSLEGHEAKFPYTKEGLEKQAKSAITNWDKNLEKWTDDNELWDCFITQEWFQKVYVNSLSDYHSGDCTAFACSCSRCHAENMFKIPNTANWSKSEGSKMEHAFMKDIKKQKDLKTIAVSGDNSK